MIILNADEDAETLVLSYIAGGDVVTWQCLQTNMHLLAYDPAITFLDIDLRESKLCSHKTCTKMLLAVLLVLTKYWKQSKCLQCVNC